MTVDPILFQQVLAVLKQSPFMEIDLSTVTPNTAMMADLAMSSLSLMMFASDLEDKFDMEFPNGGFHELITLGDICGYLSDRRIS